MPVLHLIFGIFLTICFLWLVFLFSWYVALPLLFIWAIWGFARWLYARILSLRYRSAANGCTLHQTGAPKHTHTTIIDAEYTEVP